MAYTLGTALLFARFCIVVIKSRPQFAVSSVGFLPCIHNETSSVEGSYVKV